MKDSDLGRRKCLDHNSGIFEVHSFIMNIIEILPYGSNVDRYQVNLGQENLNQVNLESGQCQVD